jgi:alpha-D-ribose 1-methylphosphonate 5-triphosphate diphosphatase
MAERVFRNALIVLPDEVVHGSVAVRGGTIAAVDSGSGSVGEDWDGDWLIPGLVELHTDHLESHFAPRPRVRWNGIAAVQAHDAQIAASGITTVFDAIRVGADEDIALTAGDMRVLAEAVGGAQAEGRLRAEHFIHLRCEVAAPDVMEAFALLSGLPLVRLASLMDHTPGQRQFTSLEAFRVYYQGRNGMSDAAFEAFVAARQERVGPHADRNRAAIAAACREAGIVLASHDDATPEHVAEAAALGISVAEFPTTLEAARASRAAGLKVLMGAPNVVRGGSHSGNVSARDLAAAGLLDALSSDYIPLSLIHAAFRIAQLVPEMALPQAIAAVSLAPAAIAGLDDRGAIALGRRADLVRVRRAGDVPLVREVWRGGSRVV